MSAWWRISLSEIADSYLIELRNFLGDREHDAMKMDEIDIQDYARQLLEAHENEGKTEDAETWRRIEAALKLMRGPHQK
jgi:hypothetical protein